MSHCVVLFSFPSLSQWTLMSYMIEGGGSPTLSKAAGSIAILKQAIVCYVPLSLLITLLVITGAQLVHSLTLVYWDQSCSRSTAA